MNIFVDESGLFAPAERQDAWNAVGAYVVPETARRGVDKALAELKKWLGVGEHEEVKLRHLDGEQRLYPCFLEQLNRLDGVLYASAANAFLDSTEVVARHQSKFVASTLSNEPRMRYEGGKAGVRLLAAQVAALSPQLYAQLVHQIGLIEHVARSAINYFAQRHPPTLSAFRWRIDRKDASPGFEDAFQKMVPMLLQSASIRTPSVLVRGFNYSFLKEFWMPIPSYLKDDYGIDLEGRYVLDLQKIFRENLQFLDSKGCVGLQVVDLLVSGVRRCLRGEFKDRNDSISGLLGRLMVQPAVGDTVIRLATFSSEQYLTGEGRRALLIMQRHARPMLMAGRK